MYVGSRDYYGGLGRTEVPVRTKSNVGGLSGDMKKSTTKLARKAQLSVGPSSGGLRGSSQGITDENGRSVVVKKVKKVSRQPPEYDLDGRPSTAPMNHGSNSAEDRGRLPMAWGTPSFDGPSPSGGAKLTRSRTMPSKAAPGGKTSVGAAAGLRPRSASSTGPQDIHGHGRSVMAHRNSGGVGGGGGAAPVLATQRRSLTRSSSAPADRGAHPGAHLQKAHAANPGLIGSWSKRAHSAPSYSKAGGPTARGAQPRLSVAGSHLEGRAARPSSAGHAGTAGGAHHAHLHGGGGEGSPPGTEAAEAAAQRAMRRAERLLALQHVDKDKLHVAVLELQAAQRDLAARSGSPEAGDLASTDLASRMGGGGRLRRHHVNRLGTVHAQSEDSLRAQLGKEVRSTERELARAQNALADREAAAAAAAAGRAGGGGGGWVGSYQAAPRAGGVLSPTDPDLSGDVTSPSSQGSGDAGTPGGRRSPGRGFAGGVGPGAPSTAAGGGGRVRGPGTPEPHGEIGAGEDEWETVFREDDSPPGGGGGPLVGWEDPPTPPRTHAPRAGGAEGRRALARAGARPGAPRGALAASQAVQARLMDEVGAFGDTMGVGEAWGGLLEELLAGDGAGGAWMSPRRGHSRSPVRGAPPSKSPSRSPVRLRGGRASPVNRPGSPTMPHLHLRERPARRL